MRSASRPCAACGRATDRYSELCVHCRRGRSAAATLKEFQRQWPMSATAFVDEVDDLIPEDRDLRIAMIAD